ncbi:hybrid sensor histidine kinase/response regulator [Noviherbaspirillum pedocola]|uniref:histidine kinase n=1 Tax=Noviherbaspirillum pedocola TaxID=2801341 RepID=A0A934T466_9BURK|nr:ATP-binding protein [Noviherbaspirillum pedocola]MBK4738758.1 response regulator [Noviherbaspirillum pedocola]
MVAQALRGDTAADLSDSDSVVSPSPGGERNSRRVAITVLGVLMVASSTVVGHLGYNALESAQATHHFAQTETTRLEALTDMRMALARLDQQARLLALSPNPDTAGMREAFLLFQQRYLAYLKEANYGEGSVDKRSLRSNQAWLMEYDTRINTLITNFSENPDIAKDVANLIDLMNKPLADLVADTRRDQEAQLSSLEGEINASRKELLLIGGIAVLIALCSLYWIVRLAGSGRAEPISVIDTSRVETATQEVLNARNEFIGQISHELATPLQTMSASIEMLEDSRNLVSDADKRLVARMALACRTMQNYVKDMKDFARLKAGKLELRKEDFNPSNLLEDIAAEHAAAAKEKNLEIILQIDQTNRDLMVNADPYRFQQVVNNLLSNAIKYTSSGQIRCWLDLELTDPPSLLLKIHDTGTGVDSSAVGRIFEPFIQEDHAPVPAGGIGMGLAIVKDIVDWQGGEFGIESALDSGTRFRIRLPVEIRRPELRTHPAVLPEATEKHHRVLLIDDNIAILDSLRNLVQSCGYSCDDAAGGHAGLMKIHNEAYSAVLLDINMPDIDGYHVAEAIRSRISPNQKIPIIVVTGNLENQSTPAQKNLFTAFLRKPIDRKTLCDTLHTHIEAAQSV